MSCSTATFPKVLTHSSISLGCDCPQNKATHSSALLSAFFITPLSSVNLRLNAHVCALIANAHGLPYKREVPYPAKLSSLWAAQGSLLLCCVQPGWPAWASPVIWNNSKIETSSLWNWSPHHSLYCSIPLLHFVPSGSFSMWIQG